MSAGSEELERAIASVGMARTCAPRPGPDVKPWSEGDRHDYAGVLCSCSFCKELGALRALFAEREAARDEAIERCEALEDAVRENLPEVTCDADGNLESDEVCRIETVGVLYARELRIAEAVRDRLVELCETMARAKDCVAVIRNVDLIAIIASIDAEGEPGKESP